MGVEHACRAVLFLGAPITVRKEPAIAIADALVEGPANGRLVARFTAPLRNVDDDSDQGRASLILTVTGPQSRLEKETLPTRVAFGATFADNSGRKRLSLAGIAREIIADGGEEAERQMLRALLPLLAQALAERRVDPGDLAGVDIHASVRRALDSVRREPAPPDPRPGALSFASAFQTEPPPEGPDGPYPASFVAFSYSIGD